MLIYGECHSVHHSPHAQNTAKAGLGTDRYIIITVVMHWYMTYLDTSDKKSSERR